MRPTFLAQSVCLLALGAVQLAAADQVLGGTAAQGNLRVTVKDDGSVSLEYYHQNAWVTQYFNGPATPRFGTHLKLGATVFNIGAAQYAGNDGTAVTWTSNTLSGDTVTSTRTIGGWGITQSVTYGGTGGAVQFQWSILNGTGATAYGLSLINARDTYLLGNDLGGGFYNEATGTIGARRTVGGMLPSLTFGGGTRPDTYYSARYSDLSTLVETGLNGFIDPSELEDNGYGLQWNLNSLASGAAWNITATETVTVEYGPLAPSDANAAPDAVVEGAANGTVVGITALATDEDSPSLTYSLANDDFGRFAINPATGVVTVANGSLLLASDPTPHVIQVRASDGTHVSAPTSFTITVTPQINNAPSFVKGPDLTVPEDSGAHAIANWATAINPGAPAEAAQILDFVVTGNTNPGLFSSLPAVSPAGTLVFAVAPDANGSATITLHLRDDGSAVAPSVNVSASQSFAITVSPVNDRPSFTPGPNLTVAEDAGAQSLPWAALVSAGPANEAGQALAFTVANDSPASFSVQPAIAADGTLTFTPADDANGTAIVSVRLADDGGGDDRTALAYFTITITAANDAPVFAMPPAQTILEDGSLTLADAASLSLSDVDAGSGWLMATLNLTHGTFTTSPSPGLIFLVGSGVADRSVTFMGDVAEVNAALAGMVIRPTPDYHGPMALSLAVNDWGNSGSGDSNQVTIDTLGITVLPVNDPPACTLRTTLSATADGRARAFANWATGILAGPADEAGQAVHFAVSVDRPGLFRTQPAIAADGRLTFTPALIPGTVVMTVVPVDDGGTANGGQDHGVPLTCTITLHPMDDDRSWWAEQKTDNYDGRCGGGAIGGMLLGLALLGLRRRSR